MIGTRILVATYFDVRSVGGLSTHVQTLLVGLRSKGAEALLLDGRQACPPFARLGCMVRSGGSRDAYRVAVTKWHQRQLADDIHRAMAAFRPDVIHVHDIYAAASLADLAPSLPPVIFTVHGPALQEAMMSGVAPVGSRYYGYIAGQETAAFRAAAHIIAVDTLQQSLVLEKQVPPAHVSVIMNAVDATEFSARDSTSESYVLVPRRLVPKNGVGVAIRAFAMVVKHSPGVRLVIAGDGPLHGELHALSVQLGIADSVRFLGDVAHDDMPGLVAGAQVVLIPSVPASGVIEATSISALEAMAAARPVIASAIGGLAELIDDGVTGLLVPPAVPEVLAETLSQLLADGRRRDALGQAARAQVLACHGLDTWTNRIWDVYRKCLS